jgi:hypothetical protein
VKALPLIAALVPALALAQATTTPEPAAAPAAAVASMPHAMIKASETKWGDAPAALPKGAKAVVLYGDPGKAGPFSIRLNAPAGYKVPRHWHPTDEQVTVISGDLTLDMDKDNNAHSATFGAGDYVNLPAHMQHEASTKSGAVVQISAMGPFEITYVDPKDDPRKAAPAAK